IAFDIEKTQLNAIETSGWAVRAMGHLEYLAGFRPLIYSYPDFISNYLKAPSLGAYPLWLAWYQDKLPKSFAQWGKIALCQKVQMRIEGVEGEVDQNIFFLGRKELEAYGKK